MTSRAVSVSSLGSDARMVRFDIPLPPSVNHFKKIGKNRPYGSVAYTAWKQEAGLCIMTQRIGKIAAGGLLGDLRVEMIFARRGDIDNRIKPTLDLLQSMGIFQNDSQVSELRVTFGDVKGCVVTIEVDA